MLFLRWIISALAFFILPYIIPGIGVKSLVTALVLALLWGLLNITIKPLFILLTLPFNILTLGLFTFVINGFVLYILGGIVKGFEVQSFGVAILGALFLSIVSALSHLLLKND